MKWIWLTTIFFFIFSSLGLAQENTRVDYTPLLEQLETEVAKGNLIALRDLGTLLDKKNASNQALTILKNYTFFLDKELNWNQKINRQTFLNFFYSHKNQIRFFHPAEVFYIAALDIEKVDYKIESLPRHIKNQKTIDLRRSINAFEKVILNENEKKIKQKLKDIIALNTRESRHYLLQIMQEQLFQKSKIHGKIDLIILLSQSLQNQPTLETLEEILLNTKKGFLPFDEAKVILAHLTNHSLAEITTPKQGVKYFTHLIDSLETIENIRHFGYEKVFHFNKYIFPHEVDYFGRILNLADQYPWMKKNAIQDLMNTEHERAYLYLAADFYKNYLTKEANSIQPILSKKTYENLFIEYNQLIVRVLASDGKYKNIFNHINFKGCKDDILKRNFLMYWMSHHEDFEWNQSYQLFINKHEILAKTENYEKLFRRLNSSNNEVAMNSFSQLAEGIPAEILNLSNKYRQLLRSYNKTLPNIRHLYLEELSQLTDFCRNNNIPYQPSNQLQRKLDNLREKIPASERYQLENRIINSLELNEVTALEYYACLYEKNNDFTFSAGRILDHFYSQHWESIIYNDSQLRLYLKKTALFKRIGTIGSCNVYINKLKTNSKDLTKRLNELLEVEPDDDIIFLIELLSPQKTVVKRSELIEFIENPIDFSKNDIRILPMASMDEFQKIIDQMKVEEEVSVLKKYLAYLRKTPTIEAIPIYFQLIDNQKVITKKYNVPITLADLIIPVIEKSFKHHLTPKEKTRPFATEKWRNLWNTDGKNYKNWVSIFFEQKLKQIQFADKLKIKVIDEVFAAEHYSSKYKARCLEGLKKVRPIKTIKRLKTPEKLSVKTDLKYFEDFYFSYKELDDIPKLFEVDDAEMMFDYLVKKSMDFDPSELGTFWNNVFRQNWFLNFINTNNQKNTNLENIKIALQTYLHESDLISEYEEQITNLNISMIESLGKDLISKLTDSIHSQKDEATKSLIQQSILARASYEDIGQIVAIIDQLSSSQNFHPYLFLQKDFGLPIFDLGNEKIRKELITHHKKMSKAEFYTFYLQAFGVDFLTKKDKLDYQKIYALLQYEIITPFVGGGGSHRDQFTYGLVKILELHFGTRLGFHKKLNENQTFYSFISTKRANAWRTYLSDNQIVKVDKKLPPSFNHIVIGSAN